MAFLSRHPFSVLIVGAGAATLAAALIFARPQYHREYESPMIDFATVRHYEPAVVRRAFAAHGVRLRYENDFAGIVVYGNTRERFAGDLHVMVGPRRGTGSWGPELEPYDERFGNVFVSYGGNDERLLRAVTAAVDDLR